MNSWTHAAVTRMLPSLCATCNWAPGCVALHTCCREKSSSSCQSRFVRSQTVNLHDLARVCEASEACHDWYDRSRIPCSCLHCSLGLCLTPWMCPLQDLTYKVRNNNNRRQKVTLLYKISGFFVPGELTALVWHSL